MDYGKVAFIGGGNMARALAGGMLVAGYEPGHILISEPLAEHRDSLAEEFSGLAVDTTEEHMQARCRGVLLMAIANKKRRIVLTTGNKSEMAVGYATLYGDMAGASMYSRMCPSYWFTA